MVQSQETLLPGKVGIGTYLIDYGQYHILCELFSCVGCIICNLLSYIIVVATTMYIHYYNTMI